MTLYRSVKNTMIYNFENIDFHTKTGHLQETLLLSFYFLKSTAKNHNLIVIASPIRNNLHRFV